LIELEEARAVYLDYLARKRTLDAVGEEYISENESKENIILNQIEAQFKLRCKLIAHMYGQGVALARVISFYGTDDPAL